MKEWEMDGEEDERRMMPGTKVPAENHNLPIVFLLQYQS